MHMGFQPPNGVYMGNMGGQLLGPTGQYYSPDNNPNAFFAHANAFPTQTNPYALVASAMAVTSMASTCRTKYDPHEGVMYMTFCLDTACTHTLVPNFKGIDYPVHKPGLLTGIGPHAFQTQGTGVLKSEAFKTRVSPQGHIPVLVSDIINTPLLAGVEVADLGIHAIVTDKETRFYDAATNQTLFMGHRVNREIIVKIPLPPYTYEDIAKLNM
jgi:hypothetical protein